MSDVFTFIGGVAVGSLIARMAKNKKTRVAVEHFIDGMGQVFSDFLHQITPSVKDTNIIEDSESDNVKMKSAKTVKKTSRSGRVSKKKKDTSAKMPLH